MSSRCAAVTSAVLLALVLASPPAAPAQVADRGGLLGLGIRVAAFAGPAGSLADLGNVAGVNRTQAFRTELKTGWAAGGAVEVPVFGAFSLRGDARFAPGAEMLTESLTCPVGGVTSQPDHCAARSDGSFWTATGGLVYRTRTTPGMPSAFFHAGAGVKRYDFSTSPTMEGLGGEELYSGECLTGDRVCDVHVRDGYAGEHTDVTGRLGIGLSLDVGGVRLAGELSDYVSIFAPTVTNDRTLQHELFLTFEVAPGL